MLRLITSVSLSLFVSCGALAAGETSIDRLAPKDSVIIAGTKNMKAFRDHITSTKLWALWQSDQFKPQREELLKGWTDLTKKMSEEIGVEEDALTCPDGALGFAMFPVMNEDVGLLEPHWLLVADWGDNAEKTNTILQATLTEGEKKGELEYEEKDVLGRKVYTIEPKQDADADAGGMGMGEDAEDGGLGDVPGMDPEGMMGAMQKVHVVRDGTVFLASSNIDSLTDALSVIDGKGEPGADQGKEYQAIMKQVGGEADMHAVVLVDKLVDMLSSDEDMGMMMMIVPMVQSAIGDIRGAGLSLRMESGTAMMEQRFSIYMPNGKQGLSGLFDLESPRAELPKFVGPDTVSYTTFNFKFTELMGVVKQVIAGNPMIPADPEQMAQIEQMVQQVTATLGTQVHYSTSITKPMGADSSKSVMAIQCTNPLGFENFFGQFAPQMGLEPRDFLGQRIYSMDPAMMGMADAEPISLGVGGGLVLVGPTPAVEQALRTSGQADSPSLQSDAEFSHALRPLAADGAVAWGYMSTIDALEAEFVKVQADLKKQVESFREFDPEFADQMAKEFDKSLGWMKELDYDAMRKYIGPQSWQIRSVEDGFVGVSYLLDPPATP